MGWKASKPHKSSKTMEGKEHFDVYQTDKTGKRDQPHREDVKISGEPHEPSMRDVHPPKGKGKK